MTRARRIGFFIGTRLSLHAQFNLERRDEQISKDPRACPAVKITTRTNCHLTALEMKRKRLSDKNLRRREKESKTDKR